MNVWYFLMRNSNILRNRKCLEAINKIVLLKWNNKALEKYVMINS